MGSGNGRDSSAPTPRVRRLNRNAGAPLATRGGKAQIESQVPMHTLIKRELRYIPILDTTFYLCGNLL